MKPEEYRRLGNEYGIYLTEIVDPDEYRVAKDKNITPHQVQTGMKTLIQRIEHYRPNRVAFVGKNAATWFYRYNEDKKLTDSQSSEHKNDRQRLNYGELDWDYRGLGYCLLTNLHWQWNRDVWMGFWQRCKEDVDQFR